MSETATIEAEVLEAGGCRKRLSVRIPAEEVSREFDETVHRYAKAIRVPGFRRGKVPPALVRKRFAHEIEEEVRDHLVRSGLRQALERHHLHPLHDPVVEASEVKQGEPYAYTALFEVTPEIPLGEYRGLPVSLREPSVTDEDVDRALDEVRERLAKFVSVDPKPIDAGDYVLVDLAGQYEDGKGKDFKHEGVMIEVGSDSNLPEFNEALPSMTVGEPRSFAVKYPDDFGAEHLAGRTVRYTLTAKSIKKKELPPVDEELPKDLGKAGSLAQLRDEIRADLLAGHRRAAEREAKESLLRQLIEKHRVEVPEIMVEEQVNLQLEERVRSMIASGIHPAKTDVDWNQVRQRELPLAAQRILGMLILEEIARREGISVTEADFRQRLAEEARKQRETAEELEKRLGEGRSSQALKNQMVREKSLDFLLKNATISS